MKTHLSIFFSIFLCHFVFCQTPRDHRSIIKTQSSTPTSKTPTKSASKKRTTAPTPKSAREIELENEVKSLRNDTVSNRKLIRLTEDLLANERQGRKIADSIARYKDSINSIIIEEQGAIIGILRNENRVLDSANNELSKPFIVGKKTFALARVKYSFNVSDIAYITYKKQEPVLGKKDIQLIRNIIDFVKQNNFKIKLIGYNLKKNRAKWKIARGGKIYCRVERFI